MSAPISRYHPRTDVPRLIAHRGASARAPENTIAAFEEAARLGVRWVEFDVMLCGDGTPVVIHDEALCRTTGAEGRVAETGLDALKRLDAGRWFSAAFAGQTVPTLAEALAALDRFDLGANVEIKPAEGHAVETGEAVACLLRDHWPARLAPPVVSSFSPEALRAAHAVHPGHDYAPLFDEIGADWRAHMDAVGAQALHCDAARLTADRAAAVLATGAAMRCYTVNDPAEARRLLAMGVGSVFSDDAIPLD